MINIENTINSLDYTIRSLEDTISKKEFYQTELEKLKKESEDFNLRITFAKDCKELYIKAIDVLYEKSIGVLKETLDTALQYVIFDEDYSTIIKIDDSRGNKTLEITVWDNKRGFEADLIDGTGKGVRAVISFVLKMYYLLNEGSKVLCLDEKYSAISQEYVPLFFDFVKRMMDEKGFIMVMITHDPRFQAYADRVYTINEGQVQLLNGGI